MSSIDQRIVELDLKNQNFEKNASVSISTLDKLKNALNFGSTTKELNELDRASKGINFSTMAGALDNISVKFSSLGTIAFSVLNNITNKAVDTGLQIAKSLTIDPISTGYAEYEEKINSIRTMLMSSGYKLPEIKKQLEDLNLYADKTIYSFRDMTSNIGKFTNAGVDLKVAVKAMKGISNEAAVSGANTQEASRAMYNIAQSLSMGYMQYIDWKSIENANMATVEFKENLVKTAIAMGKVKKTQDGLYNDGEQVLNLQQMFKDGLKDQWLTSDVLLTTLQDYADEETEIGKKAFEAATKVRTFTQLMDTLREAAQSGWANTWELIVGDFNEATDFMTEISDEISGILDMMSTARNKLVEGWKEGGGRAAAIDSLRNIYKAIGGLIKPVKDAFRAIFPPLTAKRLVSMTEAVKNFTSKLILTKNATKVVFNVFKTFFSIVKSGFGIIKSLIISVKNALVYINNSLHIVSGVKKAFSILFKLFSGFEKYLSSFTEKSSKKVTTFKDVFKGVVNSISSFMDKIKKAFEKLKDVKKVFKNFISGIKSGFSGYKTTLTNFFNTVSKVVRTLIDSLVNAFKNADFEKAGKAGILATLLLIANKIRKGVGGITDSIEKLNVLESIKGILDSVKDVFSQMKSSLESWQKDLDAKRLLKLAGAVAILSLSILVLSSIPPGKLLMAGYAISMLFIMLVGAMKMFEEFFDPKKMRQLSKSSGIFIKFAAGILVLSIAMKMLSKMSWPEIGRGIVALAGTCTLLVAAMKVISTNKNDMKNATNGLIKFAISVLLMAVAFKQLSKLSWSEIGRGIAAMAGIVVLIAGFEKIIDKKKSKAITRVATAMILIAAAMLLFVKVFQAFGGMDWKVMGKGAAALGGILAIIAAFSAIDKKLGSKKLIKTALALLIISGAMKILSGVMQELGKMNMKEIGKALAAIGGALLIILVAAKLMPKSMILTATGLLIMAVALKTLAVAIGMLSKLSWGSIGKAAAVLGGSLIILGAAAAILSPVIPAMFALVGVLTLLGVACLAVGAGIALLATGLSILAVTGSVGITTLVAAATALLELLPLFGRKLAEFFVVFLETTAENLPRILEAFGTMVLGIITTIDKYIPKIVETGFHIIISLLQGIRDNMYEITVLTVEIIAEFINGIADSLDDIINAGVNLIISFIEGMADAIDKNTDRMLDACDKLIIAMLKAMVKTVIHGIENLKKAGKKLMDSGFVKGIKQKWEDTKEWFHELPSKIWEWLKEKVGDMVNVGKNFIQGFIDGIKGKSKDAETAASDVADGATKATQKKLQEKSPSRVMKQVGKFFTEGFANGIKDSSDLATTAAGDMANGALSKFQLIMSDIDEYIDDIDSNPVITPVLDLSNLESGTSKISSMFGNRTVKLGHSIGTSKSADGYFVGGNSITNYNFTQNNNSPKPLSRIDIYRQTRNQFAEFKELVS